LSFPLAESSNETHKRSKSILKNKADSRLADPESERLLSDTGSGVSDISVIPVSFRFDGAFVEEIPNFLLSQADGSIDFSPNKIPKSISPQLSQHRHHRLVHQRSTPISIGRQKYQTPRQTEETMLRQSKPTLQRGIGFGGTTISCDSSGHSGKPEFGTRESSLGKPQ
jgi:hypothetical protein